ncbi:HNH endonuclease [Lysinibacillus contaminans]|uniref:HNH endonuclease n=1 Tax=Lysinibacillus contaminans TaxID=1293441 RepID=UPI0006AF22A0|nr:HNH endonuclease [Lysinibacillus contaminans]
MGITAFDLLTPADVAHATNIQAINATFEGDVHPVSGVPFDRAEIHYNDQIISDVFPETYTAQIPEAHYLNNDQLHFQEANEQFAGAIHANFALANQLGLSDMDLENLQQGVTPQGYTWHHHEQPGQLQLVDSELHGQTAHTGGRFIWGRGSMYR